MTGLAHQMTLMRAGIKLLQTGVMRHDSINQIIIGQHVQERNTRGACVGQLLLANPALPPPSSWDLPRMKMVVQALLDNLSQAF